MTSSTRKALDDMDAEVSRPQRELLGTVTTSFGSVDVYRPTMGDLASINEPTGSAAMIYKLAAACCNVSYGEFCEWSVDDGMAVIDKINKGIDSMQHYLGHKQ